MVGVGGQPVPGAGSGGEEVEGGRSRAPAHGISGNAEWILMTQGEGQEGVERRVSQRPALAEVEEEWARAGVATAKAQGAQASLYSVLICGYLEKGWVYS